MLMVQHFSCASAHTVAAVITWAKWKPIKMETSKFQFPNDPTAKI